jgi:hypothetical protein
MSEPSYKNVWWESKKLWVAYVVATVAAIFVPAWFGRNSADLLWQIAWSSSLSWLALTLGLSIVLMTNGEERKRANAYETVRAQLVHEDNLINHRLSWLMTSQAFLFAAFALQYTGNGNRPRPYVFDLIPYVALISAVVIYASVAAAVGALENLRHSYAITENAKTNMEMVGNQYTMMAGLVTPLLLPVVMVCIWTLLITR